MSPRTTAVLFAIAAALGAFVYFYEIRGEDARKQAEEAEKRIFPGLEAEQVESVWLLTTDGVSAKAERREGGWHLVEPLDFPADTVTLDGMASTLAQLASDGSIAQPQAPAVYGLSETEAVVHFRAGGKEYGLQMGSKTPVDAKSYVSPLGSDAVYTVPTWRLNSLRKSLLDMRDRRVLVFNRDGVDRIEASWPKGGVTLEKRDGEWRVVAPVEDAADSGTVDGLLSDLSFLRADGFVDDPPPDAEAGLAKPDFAVTLRTGAPEDGKGEAPEVHFALGSSLDGKTRLARGSQTSLYRVPSERLADFPREVVAYRFKQLAHFPVSEARTFDLEVRSKGGEEETLHGQRTGTDWETEPRPFLPQKASELVSELADLEAVDIESDAPSDQDLAKLGLAPPRARLRVLGKAPEGGEAPVLAEVLLGESDADKGIAAKRADRATVFRLDHAMAEHLPASLEALHNRFLAPEVPPAAATKPGAESSEGGGARPSPGGQGGDSSEDPALGGAR